MKPVAHTCAHEEPQLPTTPPKLKPCLWTWRNVYNTNLLYNGILTGVLFLAVCETISALRASQEIILVEMLLFVDVFFIILSVKQVRVLWNMRPEVVNRDVFTLWNCRQRLLTILLEDEWTSEQVAVAAMVRKCVEVEKRIPDSLRQRIESAGWWGTAALADIVLWLGRSFTLSTDGSSFGALVNKERRDDLIRNGTRLSELDISRDSLVQSALPIMYRVWYERVELFVRHGMTLRTNFLNHVDESRVQPEPQTFEASVALFKKLS